MNRQSLPTSFAPAERDGDEALVAQMRALASGVGRSPLLGSISEILAILNEHRQVVYCNRRLLELLGASLEDVLGKRPGAVLGCIHSRETPGGCGTTEFCEECGAVQGSPVGWDMRITSPTHAPPLEEFVWYGGQGQLDRTSGTWTTYDPATPASATAVLRIDWTHAAPTDNSWEATAMTGCSPTTMLRSRPSSRSTGTQPAAVATSLPRTSTGA